MLPSFLRPPRFYYCTINTKNDHIRGMSINTKKEEHNIYGGGGSEAHKRGLECCRGCTTVAKFFSWSSNVVLSSICVIGLVETPVLLVVRLADRVREPCE